jgi:hypothetical protein
MLPRLALLLGLLAGPALPQPEFSLAGHVRNAATGQPVPHARVAVIRHAGPFDVQAVTFTDVAGAFRFPALPSTGYLVLIQKPGFELHRPLSSPSVQLTAPVENLSYSLLPYGVIAGQLRDGDGDPLPLVQVQLFREEFIDGRREINPVGRAVTDDRGLFRMPHLPAGRYFVRAMSRAGGVHVSPDEAAPASVGRHGFAPVYAGGASRAPQASPTLLAPGQQARVAFRLPLLPAYRLRGNLSTPAPSLPLRFELRAPGAEPIEPRAQFHPASGVFTIFDLLPGSYQLRALQGEGAQQLIASALVQVGPGASAAVALTAHPPPTISLRFDGPGVLPCQVHLYRPASPRHNPVVLVADKPNPVPAGDYTIQATCYDVAIESLRLGSVDLLGANRLSQPAAASPAVLTVTRSARSGFVSLHRAAATLSSPLLIVPATPAQGGPQLLAAIQPVQLSFPLLPGDYTIYALPTAEFPFRDPAFLAKLRARPGAGVAVRVEAGQTAAVTLSELAQP